MRAFYLATAFSLASLYSSAQQDSVSMGAGYQLESWYSLQTGLQNQHNINTWDLAFEVSPTGYAIRTNAGTGVNAYVFPGDTTQFNTLDTTGIANWTSVYNGELSWTEGALNSLESGLDVGWGEYNMNTHVISGNRIFVIGTSLLKKVMIQDLTNGQYHIRIANLDNSNDTVISITKSDFSGQLFGYLNLSSGATLSLEPSSTDWDLYFGKYTADLGIPYNVTGVLINPEAEAVKVYPVNDVNTYSDWSNQSYSSDMNVIGYDWKSFTGMGYDVADSTVYFVKNVQGDVYKIVFTGFEGSTTGMVHFNKTLMSELSINENHVTAFQAYPNPATDNLTLVLNQKSESTYQLTDMNGRVVLSNSVKTLGLSTIEIRTDNLTPGTYVLQVQSGQSLQSEIIIIQ